MLSKWLTEILVLLAVGLGVACVCIWLHEHGICPLNAIKKVVRKMSFIGICVLALWAVPLIQYGSTKGGGTNNVQNVANVEMLPMANSNIQLGNGNIGTGNNFTMAGEAFDFAAPSNAVVCADWRAFGAATDWIYVALTNWAFQVATNDVDRLRIHSDGWLETGTTGILPVANFWPLKTILGIVPEANWHLLAANHQPPTTNHQSQTNYQPPITVLALRHAVEYVANHVAERLARPRRRHAAFLPD